MPRPPSTDPVRGHRGRGPTRLPAEGRLGPVPEWPFPDMLEGESGAWVELWRTPQAVAWERLGWIRTVARYCRLMVRCDDPESGAALHAAATAMEDRLGLNPKAMRLLLWEIASDEVAEKRQVSKGARGRIKAVG